MTTLRIYALAIYWLFTTPSWAKRWQQIKKGNA